MKINTLVLSLFLISCSSGYSESAVQKLLELSNGELRHKGTTYPTSMEPVEIEIDALPEGGFCYNVHYEIHENHKVSIYDRGRCKLVKDKYYDLHSILLINKGYHILIVNNSNGASVHDKLGWISTYRAYCDTVVVVKNLKLMEPG